MIAQPGVAVRAVAASAEIVAARTVGRLADTKVGGDLILQTQLPGPGAGRMVAPEAAVGHGQGGVGLAFGVDAGGPVAHSQVRPVVVFATAGAAQLFPPLLGLFPVWVEQGPEGGGVDHDAVVQVGGVGGISLAGGAFGVGGGRTALGALGHAVDEGVELFFGPEQAAVALLCRLRRPLFGAVAGGAQIAQLALDAVEGGYQVVGQ